MRVHLGPNIGRRLGGVGWGLGLVEVTKVARFGCSSFVHLLQRTLSGVVPVRDWNSDLAISSVTGIVTPSKFMTEVGTSGIMMVVHLLAGSTSAPSRISRIFDWLCRIACAALGDA